MFTFLIIARLEISSKRQYAEQESQRAEMGGVMARWREEVRNIQQEHEQEHKELQEVGTLPTSVSTTLHTYYTPHTRLKVVAMLLLQIMSIDPQFHNMKTALVFLSSFGFLFVKE